MEQVATPIVDTPEDLTAEWFTSALREGGTLAATASVSSARSELIGTGQVGMVVRSELSYDDDTRGAPASVVVKLPSREAGARQVGVAMGLYESETRFYKEIAPLAGIAVPGLHWGDVEADTGRITLVIDDLTGSAEVGDMIATSTPEQAELAFAELVKLQAPLWNDPQLRSLKWLADPARAQVLFDAVAPAIEPFKEAYGHRLDASHVALVERLGPKAATWPAKALVDPLVVIHGDYRLDNMMFDSDGVTILDWQACRLGPPLLDHSIFLGSCMSTEDRRAHELDLLRGYHDGLVAAGVRDFTWDDCLRSYAISSLYPFLLTVSMSLFLAHTDRDREVWTQLLRGCAELVEDHGAADLLVIPAPQPGSVALITGASSGIGRELAKQLSARGHDLVIVARRRDRLEELASELPGRVEVLACDVSEPAGRAAIAALGLTVDVLVPCAGFGMGGEFIAQDPARVQLMIRTNLESTVALCGMFAPGMVERSRGAILIVSSMAGNQPMTLFGVYSATKAAVTSFGEMLHEEVRPSGVSVTVLCPGSVSTEFATVADMAAAEKRVRGPFTATPEATARAGLEALDANKRHVVPGRAVQVLHFAGGHAPRGLWLRACRKLMA